MFTENTIAEQFCKFKKAAEDEKHFCQVNKFRLKGESFFQHKKSICTSAEICLVLKMVNKNDRFTTDHFRKLKAPLVGFLLKFTLKNLKSLHFPEQNICCCRVLFRLQRTSVNSGYSVCGFLINSSFTKILLLLC